MLAVMEYLPKVGIKPSCVKLCFVAEINPYSILNSKFYIKLYRIDLFKIVTLEMEVGIESQKEHANKLKIKKY